MPVQSLPPNPSFENLRKQAKSLRQAVQENEPGALARVREFHPRPDEVSNNFALLDAQLVIARSYAFSSWAKLKHHFAALAEYSWSVPAGDESKPVSEQFINLACLTYGGDHTSRRDKAREIYVANPAIGRENIYAAATVGETELVRQLLSANPSLAKVRGGPRNWEPLLYAAYSRFNSPDPHHSTLGVARLLLEDGADPNAGFLWDGHYLFTALTGVFGEGESGPLHQPEHQSCYEFARLLLSAGADPNDSQTLYNRMFTGGTKHLELLFEFGLGRVGHGVWSKRLGNQDSPAEMLQQQLGWAAKYNQMARLQLLVERGVDVNVADTRLQRTPYELALLNGNGEIAQYLLDHGAKEIPLSDLDAFFSACLGADAVRARESLARDATLIERLGSDRIELLQLAAESDKLDALRLMAELGFDLNARKRTTALHHAAMCGNLEAVKLLIELGADPSIRDTEFNATPLGWAEYGEKTEVAEFLRQFEPRTAE
jgi:ankyrin repeat protein